MEKLDRAVQQRVWRRVYGREQSLRPQDRQRLQQCHRRSMENARIFESMVQHNHYGDAFRQMARQANEHAAMLEQMLTK